MSSNKRVKLEFSVGEKLPGNDSYLIQDKYLRSNVAKADPLGTGNVGVVYRAKYKGLDRAVKFLAPSPDGDEQAQISFVSLEDAFEQEIGVLSRMTHTNICKIVDFGKATIKKMTYPYYVMDYIQGDTFDDFSSTCSGFEFLAVLNQIVSALAYIHSLNIYHMDIKEENIKVQPVTASVPHAVLLDLGGAKQVLPLNGEELRSNTTYISTEKATRPERHSYLGKKINRKDLEHWNIDLDLYALGVMIQRALEKDLIRIRLIRDLSESGLLAIEWVVNRLIEGEAKDSIDKRYYRSAADLKADLEKLLPGYMWPLGIAELSIIGGPTSIQISQKRVGMTEGVKKIINHPFFQRLHFIPQLEYVQLIYPGGTHSRFHHALSTFQMARIFISRLLHYPEFRMIVGKEHVKAALLVALLHDIGHYPLAQIFEDFTTDTFVDVTYTDDLILSEESLFENMVCPTQDDAFNGCWKNLLNKNGVSKKHMKTLSELIREEFPECWHLLPQLMYWRKATGPPLRMLQSIIDSAIDVDKISYLQLDSQYTGVNFGNGIDVDGLVEAIRPPNQDDRERGAIAIDEDGLPAAEALVLARFWMINRVYWHRTNRAIMAMHKFVLAHLIQIAQFNFRQYLEETFYTTHIEATQYLAKKFNEHPFPKKLIAPEEVRNPLTGLLNGNRHLYKRLLTIHNSPDEAERKIYEKILALGPMVVTELAEEIRTHLNTHFAKMNINICYGDLLVDIPYKGKDTLGANVLVYLGREKNTGRNLYGGDNPASLLLKNLPENYEHAVKRCRIFIHPNIMEDLEKKPSELQEIRHSVISYLKIKFNIRPDLPR